MVAGDLHQDDAGYGETQFPAEYSRAVPARQVRPVTIFAPSSLRAGENTLVIRIHEAPAR
jgi:hypothetical protein